MSRVPESTTSSRSSVVTQAHYSLKDEGCFYIDGRDVIFTWKQKTETQEFYDDEEGICVTIGNCCDLRVLGPYVS